MAVTISPEATATGTNNVGGEVIATLHAGWLRRLGVPLGFWAAGLLGYLIARGSGDQDLAYWLGGVPLVVGLLFAIGLWRRKAIIRRDGVEIRGLFTRRVQFADLEAFTFDARSYRLYLFIPIGRVANLKLVGRRGRATFHGGFARFDSYAPIVIDLAVAATVKRMREQIDRGERARFGRRLSVDHAHLYVSGRLFGEEKAAIEELHVEVADGDFQLSTPKEKLGTFSLRDTPNLLALPQLLEELSVTRGRPRPAALQEALRRTRS